MLDLYLTDDNGIYIQITGSNEEGWKWALMELKMINVSLEKLQKIWFN
jgi:hypothetical protein